MPAFNTTAAEGAFTITTGTDIFVVFNSTVIGTIQGISYSITRQKAPIYTMNSENYKAVARSKRGIAGSLVLTNTDRHALSTFMSGATFAAKPGSFEASTIGSADAAADTTLLAQRAQATLALGLAGNVNTNPTPLPDGNNAAPAGGYQASSSVGTINNSIVAVSATPLYADELLPFDVTLSAVNEQGIGSVMRIFGVEILNEGSGLSIDDTSNEIQMTYIARLVLGWKPLSQVPIAGY